MTEAIAETPRINAWSYSRLKDFEKCPHKAFLKYALKQPEPDWIDKKAMIRGKEVHKSAEDYITGKTDVLAEELHRATAVMEDLRAVFQEPGSLQIAVEEKWGFTREWEPCEYFGDTVWGRMALDAMVIDNTFATVDDWKTGKKFGNEVGHAQQAQFYAVGTFMRYPDLSEVHTRFHYVDHNGPPVTRKYTRTQGMAMLPMLDRRASEMTNATEFPARANKITCKYCPYSPNKKYGDGSCVYGVEA